MRALKIVLLFVVATTLIGCQVSRVSIKSAGFHTSPPAHGYYKKYPRQHRWDDQLGLYIFLESPDTYYDDSSNSYFRWSVGLNLWERANEPRGTWRQVHERKVPPKLIKRRIKNKKRQGPAKHAPAHGYYKKHPRQHRWDDGLGLYIFLESPDTYYDDRSSSYFRWSMRLNSWEYADEPRGKWQQVHERDVPPKLIKRRPKINHRQMNQRDNRNKRRSRQQEFERESERERYSNKRESGKDKKEQKKDRQNKKRDCEENGKGRGRSKKCRD